MEEGETKAVLGTTSVCDDLRGNSESAYKDFIKPYPNGSINQLERLMSMASDLNKNISIDDTIVSANESISTSSVDSTMTNTANRNHASQLLLAAASVVSNGFLGVPNGLRTSMVTTTNTGIPSHVVSSVGSCPPVISVSETSTRTLASSTSVSFTSKPTMSTGFAETPSMSQSILTNLTLPLSTTSAIVNSALSQPKDPLPVNALPGEKLNDNTLSSYIVVPFLWKRENAEGVIRYRSPSEKVLSSIDEVKEYLLSEDTCKCGLPCPFHIEKVFNFDSSVMSQLWKLSDIDVSVEKSKHSCCHRKYIKSNALMKQCQTVPKPLKPPPSKRRVKPTAKVTNKKSEGGIYRKAAQHFKKSPEKFQGGKVAAAASQSNLLLNPGSNTSTPIPPIETVMRNSLPFSYPSHPETGFHSPRQLSDLVSSGMTLLSPHGSSNQSSHMVPVITPTGYPPSNGSLLPQHIYRQPGDPGLLSPNSQHSYYNLPYPPGAMPPYPYSGYEFAQTHPRPWNSPPPFPSMPPPVAQLGPPFWQTRQEGSRSDVSNIVRKRQRRASSRSSNGGNSDTGYTSGLSSPAHASPGQNKLQEKAENLFKSKVLDDRRHNPIDIGSISKVADTHSGSTNQNALPSLPDNDSNKKSGTGNVLPDISVLALNPALRSEQSSGSRLPTTRTHSQNNLPSDGMQYMDPLYRARHMPPGYPHQLHQMYMPNRPPMYIAQPPNPANHMHMAQTNNIESLRNETVSDKEQEQPARKRHNLAHDLSKSKVNSKTVNTTASAQGNGISRAVSVPSGQQMLMNGFQPLFNQHMGAPGIPYPHSFGSEYGYAAQGPVHMMRAPTAQMLYRYPQSRMQVPPQVMPFHQSSNSMYAQPPFMTSPNGSNFAYAPSSTPPTSPKRKRRKGSSKTVIESHSAVLAETDNQESLPVNVESSRVQSENNATSDK